MRRAALAAVVTAALAPAARAQVEMPTTSTSEIELDQGQSADGATRVESPMVGIFYRAPNPGAPAFVDVGDAVTPGQTLCLLEAMKLFNELKADGEGVVRSIHVDNGQPVEYGQLLFQLEALSGPPVL